ncbi:MAG: 2Fe-2S iron-sulfur cluster-binding protein [Saprospiraceae bacterium]|nr:2Fe-2S iron-sulfur cluster-binding protein [Saprospiraceae bacterium]
MSKILFRFEDSRLTPLLIDQAVKGYSVLEIAEDQNIHLNHNCGGVCACSTCHVYIEKGMDFLEALTDKEEDFIDRARNPKLESRLACQCIVLDEMADLEITIPDQSQIIGHDH